MNKRAAGHVADALDNRWSFTDVKTNATITPAVVGDAQSSSEIRHMDFLNVAILNKNALNHTVSMQVRDVSLAGTVLWQQSHLVGASTTAQVAPAGLHLMATPGKGFVFTMDTVAPSVTAAVNAAGWTDQAND